jgi:hypothetical protein
MFLSKAEVQPPSGTCHMETLSCGLFWQFGIGPTLLTSSSDWHLLTWLHLGCEEDCHEDVDLHRGCRICHQSALFC